MPARYKTLRAENGSYSILDVPVFGELPKGSEKGNEQAIGREWMEAAIANARGREKEQGYLPPLHLHHHGWDQTKRAGHFRLKAVRRITYDGAPMFALFADLIDIPEEVFKQIQEGEFPYRSVEIYSFGTETINSIALLDTEEPFFRFPLLRGDNLEEPTFGASLDRGTAETVALGGDPTIDSIRLTRSKKGALVLFSARAVEDAPMTYTLNYEDGKPTLMDGTGNVLELVLGTGVAFQEDEKEPEDKKELRALIAKLKAKLKRLQGKLGEEEDEKKKEFQEDEKEEDKKPAEPAKATAMLAEVSGRLTALERLERDRAAQTKAQGLATGAIAELEAEGYKLDEKVRKDFHAFAANGEEALKRFQAAYRRSTPKVPPKTLEELEHRGPADPPEVAKFSTQGAAKLELARAAYKDYQDHQSRGQPVPPLERYIEVWIETAAMAARRSA